MSEDARLYTVQQLSRILGVSVARLRRWVRAGLIRPARTDKRLDYFDYSQVHEAKALVQMIERGATPRQIRRSLDELGQWLPDAEHALSRLQAGDDGGLVVRLAGGKVAEPSGQLRFDFPPDEPARPTPTLLRSAESWFEQAAAAEDAGQLDDAVDAYHRSLLAGGARDPDRAAETCFNLGNVLYRLERRHEAVQRYFQTVEFDPDYIEAWNNLGNALAETGRHDEAVRAFERALARSPDYADAHYNLADTLEQLGRRDDAREHWEAYLALDPASTWADAVRDRLGTR